jgi:hypothetical protein
MAFKKRPAVALFGAGLSLALPLAPGLALAQTGPTQTSAAQTSPTRTLVISSPAAGASVPGTFTVSISLVPAGGGMGGKHPHGEAFLVIDAPTPAAGDMITADAAHVAFPPGEHQISVSLPPGLHHLQIVAANHKGKVTYRVAPSAPMTITVQ